MATSQGNEKPSHKFPFARLRPFNAAAKAAFDEVVSFLRTSREQGQKIGCEEFISFHNQRTYDESVEQFRNGLEQEYLSDTPSESSPNDKKERRQSDTGKIHTGTYILTLANFPRETQNWRAGKGSSGRPAQFLLKTKENNVLVRRTHALFSFDYTTRLVKISRGSDAPMELSLNAEPLLEPRIFHKSNAHLRIAGLEFTFEYTEYGMSAQYTADQADLKNILQWPDWGSTVIKPTPMETTIMIGDWALQKPLGKGAFGTVASVVNNSGQLAAIKIRRRNELNKEAVESEMNMLICLTSLAEFFDERRVLRSREFKRDFSKEEEEKQNLLGNIYYILEPFCHYTLLPFKDYLDASNVKFMGLTKAWVLKEILHGLAFLHNNGYVHADIKHENIGVQCKYPYNDPETRSTEALETSFQIVLIDIDTAAYVGTGSDFTPLDPKRGPHGTPGFVAPERKLQPWSFPADIWAAGVVGYWLHYEQPSWFEVESPWRTDTVAAVIGQIEEQCTVWMANWGSAMLELEEESSRGVLMAGLLRAMLAFDANIEKPTVNIAKPRITVEEAIDPTRWQRIFDSCDPSAFELEELDRCWAGLLRDMLAFDANIEDPTVNIAKPRITVEEAIDPNRWQRSLDSCDREQDDENKEPPTKKASRWSLITRWICCGIAFAFELEELDRC